MKGPFSIMSFFGLTLWIDVITHIMRKKERRINPYIPKKEVSVIIPIHAEPWAYVEETVNHLYIEKYPLKNVIVCGDSKSINIEKKFYELSKKYDNFYYVRSPFQSKAKKINFVVKSQKRLLGDFVYVRDCRVIGREDCIEKMISYFNDEKVAAVTSYGRVNKPRNFLSRSFYYGKDWVNEIGRFRKNAQEKRRAVFVICGASTIFRTRVLEEIPVPSKSQTEDTYYTWKLQNKGYAIRVADDTIVVAPDVDGKKLDGIKGQIKQSFRWTSGTMQCMYNEGRGLFKNRMLAYSTILPGFIEAVFYSIPLVFIPLLFFISYKFALGFLIGDAFFSFLGTLIIMPRKFISTVIHYPQIFFFKYVNSVIFLVALAIVTTQAMFGRHAQWSNEWTPPATSGIALDSF